MKTLRQTITGADAYAGDLVLGHQVDDVVGHAPMQLGSDAPAARRRRTKYFSRRARRQVAKRALAVLALRGRGRSPPGSRRWPGSRSVRDRTSRLPTAASRCVSGSSPVAQARSRSATGRPVAPPRAAARGGRRPRAADRSPARNRFPGPTSASMTFDHSSGLGRILQQVVVVHERTEAAGDDERRQAVGELIELARPHSADPSRSWIRSHEQRGDVARQARGIRRDTACDAAPTAIPWSGCPDPSACATAVIAACRTSPSGSVLASAISFRCDVRVPRCFSSAIAVSRTGAAASSSAAPTARDASGCFIRPSASTLAHRTSVEACRRPARRRAMRRGGRPLSAAMADSPPRRLRRQRDQRTRGGAALLVVAHADPRQGLDGRG